MFLRLFYIVGFLFISSPAFSSGDKLSGKCKGPFHSTLESNGVAKKQMRKKQLPRALFLPIEHLNLFFYDFAQYGALRDMGIKSIGDLAKKTKRDLLDLRGFGGNAIDEVEACLLEKGLELGMDFEQSSHSQVQEELIKQKKLLRRSYLTLAEEKILRMKLRNGDKEPYSFRGIAQELEVTINDVWQIRRKALKKLYRFATQLGYSYPWKLTDQQIAKLIGQQKKLVNLAPIFSFSIDRLGFSIPAESSLRQNGIYYFGHLVRKSEWELLELPNVKRKDLIKVKKMLSKIGLNLGTQDNLSSHVESVESLLKELYSIKPETRSIKSFNTKMRKKLALPIEKLNLPVKAHYALKDADIHYVGDLVVITELELLKMKDVSMYELEQIKDRLLKRDLYLGVKIQWFSDPEQKIDWVNKMNSQSKRVAVDTE